MRVTYPIQAWLGAFVFTQAVEIPVYVLALRHAIRGGYAERPRTLPMQLLLAFGASAITHPMVWFVIPRIPSSSYVEYVVRAETFAVVVEAFYFYSFHVVRLKRAFVWSLGANALSAGLGFACRWAFGWP
jgi:hypothetical protein